MTEETIRLNREDLKDLKEKGFITRERFANVSEMVEDKRFFLFYKVTETKDMINFEIKEQSQFELKDRRELERMIAEQELLNLCDWKTGMVHFIYYNLANKFFDTDWCFTFTSPYRFASEESAQKAIDTLGTEKLKLIFRID